MTNPLKRKLIVVLGMHRGGTSAVTRSLQVLHVELGDDLMPAALGNNPTGFWEDIEINALNIEMLRTIDDDWHHFSPINQKDIAALRRAGFLKRAAELLNAKMGDNPIFGFKDPRTAKLLPFWRTVFTRCKFEVGYVLAIRHPLSVVRSLGKRDGFEPEKSYLLWLAHVLESLSGTSNSQRVLIDYDLLVQDPDREIYRLAVVLTLDVDSAALTNYKSEFLDASLRHTVFKLSDLKNDTSCPPLVQDIYSELLEVAADRVSLEAKSFQRNLAKWMAEVAREEGILNFADKLDAQKTTLIQTISNREVQISALKEQLIFLADQHQAPPCQMDIYLGSPTNPNIYDEEDKISRLFDLSGEFVTIEFDVPNRPEPISCLRLDPANCPCVLELLSLELCTLAGDVFWRADTPANCFRNLNDQLLIILNRELLAWILSFGADPNLELVLPQTALEKFSKDGSKLRLKLRGRKIDDKAIFEFNDFRVLLRNEIDPSQWAAQLTKKLSVRLDEENGNWEQLTAWQEASAVREQLLLAKISTLAAQSESLQSSLREEHTNASFERAHLKEQLVSADLQYKKETAQRQAAQTRATELQTKFAEREREFSEQLQSSHVASLALTQSLTEQVKAGRQEMLRLAKSITVHEQELALQRLAAQTRATELQTKLAEREREFSEQLQSSHESSVALSQSLTEQLQAGQQEVLRLAKGIAVREKEFATQLLSTQTCLTELQLVMTAFEREVEAEFSDIQKESVQLVQKLRDKEAELFSKSTELKAVKSSTFWKNLLPLR